MVGKMSDPKRGEIWLVNLDPTIGAEIRKTRPAVIISNDINNQYAHTVTILPVSDKGSKVYPFEVFLSKSTEGLQKDSKIRCQQIRTVDKIRLYKLLGMLDEDQVKKAKDALLIHLELEE